MISVDVDGVRPSDIREPHSIGSALAALELHVDECVNVLHMLADASATDEAVEAALDRWVADVRITLEALFISKGPALLFATSFPDLPLAGRRSQLILFHRHLCRGLLRAKDDLLQARERISIATYDLTSRIADHAEAIAVARDTNSMTEELWLKVIGDPIVKPPVSRLLDLGVAQAAIMDIVKFAAGSAVKVLVSG